MMNKIVIFLIFLMTLSMDISEAKSLSINLVCKANGKGLEKDRIILERELKSLGCKVRCLEGCETENLCRADINIFCEELPRHILPYAKLNWFIPNPEWCFTAEHHLRELNLILCRTREVECIFSRLNMPTYFLGFTSVDAFIPCVKKNFNRFLHLGGGSHQKGTSIIDAAWTLNPHFPHLTVISFVHPPVYNVPNICWRDSYLPLKQLRQLQNECGIHLCLSETEGYGHYLMEAMSLEAVVLTTNAPPMNEFIDDPRCLVAYESIARQQMAINYYVSRQDLVSQVKKLLYLSDWELKAIGKANRACYLKKTKEFKCNLKRLIHAIKKEI